MEYQKIFLQLISNHLPEDIKLVDFISDLIHVGKEASYRRIRCEVEFSLSEVATIAKRLNINLNSLIISEGGLKKVFNLRLLEDNTPIQQYVKRRNGDLFLLEGFCKGKCYMYSVSCSIPDELCYDFEYLEKFKLLKLQYEANEKQSTSLESTVIPQSIRDVQERFTERLSSINLTYVLDPHLFQPIVGDILFFYKLNLINDKEKKELKEDLFRVLNTIDETANTGRFKKKEISVYVSHISIPVTHTFIKDDGLEASIVELNQPNSLLSFDGKMCETHAKRIHQIKKYSSLITLSGEINKASFIKQQVEYINLL